MILAAGGIDKPVGTELEVALSAYIRPSVPLKTLLDAAQVTVKLQVLTPWRVTYITSSGIFGSPAGKLVGLQPLRRVDR